MFVRYYSIPKDCEYDDKFMSRFPILLQNRNLDEMASCMAHGIECPIGWYRILEQLFSFIEFQNIEFSRKYGVAAIADQVKEKFGTLRLYYGIRNVDENGNAIGSENAKCPKSILDIVKTQLEAVIDGLIGEAEKMTETTCAICGMALNDDNTVKTQGYVSYICKECSEKSEEGREDESPDSTLGI